MTQKELIKLLENKKIVKKTSVYEKNNDVDIEDITYNSKACTKNSVFFVKGVGFKKEYLIEAISKGTMLVVSEQEYDDIDIGIVIVNDIREAMVVVAETFWNNSYKNLITVGITGTKGKTTTATYMHNILNVYKGKRTGFLSTVETYTGKRKEESHLSTPEAIELQRYINEISDEKLEYLTMEVSSQAVKTKRILDMEYDIGMFLNISEDHISLAEHPNFNDYLNCKLEFLKKCNKVIINYETDNLENVMVATNNINKRLTYGSDKVKEKVDCYYTNIRKKDNLLYFDVIYGNNKTEYFTKMLGEFNVGNATAAILSAYEMGIPIDAIKKGIEDTIVPGRMNVFNGKDKIVIVDYAHNKLSFEKFFETIKKDYPTSDIIAVFGAPGGKAYGRRKAMSEVASKYANKVYLTADDPQYEKVTDICNEMATFLTCNYEIIEDREKAIKEAYDKMNKNSVLCLLAKGEDKYQKIKGKLEAYVSDVCIAKELTNKDDVTKAD